MIFEEIINRTARCYWLMATGRTANGYALWFAVYVKKLNWFTPIYMALTVSFFHHLFLQFDEPQRSD